MVALLAMIVMSGTVASLYAGNGTWTSTTTGLWGDGAKWSGGNVADGSGYTANFGTINITSDVTVHFDSARTIGNLTFGDTVTSSAAGWILDNNGTPANILTLAGGTPTTTVNQLGTGKSATIGLEITGTMGLTKAGNGTLILGTANTYTGATTVSAGTLAYGTNDVISTGAVTVNGGMLNLGTYSDTVGTVTVNGGDITGSGTLTGTGSFEMKSGSISAVLAGTGIALNKTTSGTVTLSGTDTYTGGTNLGAGTLSFANGALGTTGNVVFNGNSTLQWNGTNTQDISDSGRLRIDDGVTATLDTGNNTITLGNNIGLNSGGTNSTGGMAKAGNGTLILGAANTYTGVTTVSAGTLVYGANDAISTGAVTVNGGALDLGTYSDTVGTVTVNGGSITGSGTLTSTGSFEIMSGSVSAVLAGTDIALNKTTSGTATLSGANTYTGATTVSAGTLAYGANDVISTGAVTVNGGTLNLGTYSDTVGTVTVNGGSITGTGTLTSTGSFEMKSGSVSAVLAGEGIALNKSTSGTMTLSGANTYTGGTTVNSGILSISSTAALPGWNTPGQYTVRPGAALIVRDAVTDADVAAMLSTGNFTAGSQIGFDVLGSRAFDTSNLPSSMGLAKSGSGTLRLSGSNAFSGGVTLSQGQLNIETTTALGTGTFTIGGDGTCVINSPAISNFTISTNNPMAWNGNFAYGGGYNLNLGNGPVTLGSDVTIDCSPNMLTVGGNITGNHSITKTGGDRLTLSGVNSFSGGLWLKEGDLIINNGQAIGTGTFTIGGPNFHRLTNSSGGGITFSNNNPISLLSGVSINESGGSDINFGSGPVTLSASQVGFEIYARSHLTIPGPISGFGGISLGSGLGWGTLILSGSNTYQGGTSISHGYLDSTDNSVIYNTLQVAKPASLPGFDVPGKVTVQQWGMLAMNYGGPGEWTAESFDTLRANATVADGAILGFDTTNATSGATYPNSINGNIGVAKLGDNTLILPAVNNFSGGTIVTGGTLKLTNGDNRLSTTGAITVTGGTLDLGGNLQVTSGNVTLRTGAVANGILEASGKLLIDGINVPAGTVLRKTGGIFDGRAGIVSGTLANGTAIATLEKRSTGELVLSGSNTYSGGTHVYAGILRVATPAALPGYNSPGTVTVAGTQYVGAGTLAVNYGGLGDWTPAEVDALRANVTFSPKYGAPCYLGFDTTNAGGGTIYDSTISGTLGINKLGANSLTLTAVNSYSGGTQVSDGVLAVGVDNALGTGDISVTGGTLDLCGHTQALAGQLGTFGGSVVNGKILASGFQIYSGIVSADLSNGQNQWGGLLKYGDGTVVLSGNNSYVGNTTVFGGKLVVSNDAGSATGSGNVTVNAGAILAGTGTIAGRVTMNGILAPGESPGILTVNNQVTFQAGSAFNVDVMGLVAGSGYDQLLTTGPVSLAGSLTADFGSFIPTGHDMLFVLNNTGLGTTTGTFQYADNAKIGTFNGYDWYITYDANNAIVPSLNGGNDVAIYSVPEPSTIALLSIGALSLFAYACRRRRQST